MRNDGTRITRIRYRESADKKRIIIVFSRNLAFALFVILTEEGSPLVARQRLEIYLWSLVSIVINTSFNRIFYFF